MKRIKKLASLVLAMIMVLAMGITAFAQYEPEVPIEDGARITINNPAKGETYAVYKLFDATLGENGEIAYKGTVPPTLSAYFKEEGGYVLPQESILEKDAAGKLTGKTKMTDELKTALATWASAQSESTAQAVSNGDATLTFTGLPYGYYVITVTHGEDDTAKAAITVDSTTPNASVYDKNVNEPNADKTVDKESYSIGDRVKYTGRFDTTNYIGDAEKSKQVVDYLIEDTLPEYLSDVKVTKITIKNGEEVLTTIEGENNLENYQFGKITKPATAEKGIIIPWAEIKQGETTYTNLYPQGAVIEIEYEATLTKVTNIGAADTNTISIRPIVVDDETNEKEPWKEKWEDKEEIITYAAAIKKVDQDGNALAGAKFTFKGLEVEGKNGVYTVKSYNPDGAESIELATDAEGKLYILGLADDVELVVTEAVAPNGYNKLTGTKILKPQVVSKKIYATSGTKYYDADGNLVSEETEKFEEIEENNLSELDVAALEIVNNRGTLLPSTGGIGTTIFYVVGGILVVGAGILLVVKKRMSAR